MLERLDEVQRGSMYGIQEPSLVRPSLPVLSPFMQHTSSILDIKIQLLNYYTNYCTYI